MRWDATKIDLWELPSGNGGSASDSGSICEGSVRFDHGTDVVNETHCIGGWPVGTEVQKWYAAGTQVSQVVPDHESLQVAAVAREHPFVKKAGIHNETRAGEL